MAVNKVVNDVIHYENVVFEDIDQLLVEFQSHFGLVYFDKENMADKEQGDCFFQIKPNSNSLNLPLQENNQCWNAHNQRDYLQNYNALLLCLC